MKNAVYKNKLLVLSILMIAIHPLHALDPGLQIDQYHVRHWTAEDGLSQNTVRAVVQTRDGYLWLGTPSGLSRFDGKRFTQFTRFNTPELKDDRILSLYEDSSALYLGTEGGLGILKEGDWSFLTMDDGLCNNHVRVIAGDRHGTVWIGTENGLNRFTNGSFESITTRDGLYDNIITALAVDRRDRVWIGTLRGGIACWDNHAIRVYDYNDGLTSPAILTLLAEDGCLWAGTLEGLFRLSFDTNEFRRIPGTAYTPIVSLVRSDALWIGTMADGLKRLNTKLQGPEGFPDDHIHSMLVDKNGFLWIGTDSDGLFRLQDPWIRNMRGGRATSVLETRDGMVWAGTWHGLYRMQEKGILLPFEGTDNARVSAMMEDREGRLWIGTETGDVLKLEKGRFAPVQANLQSHKITSLIQEDGGVVWIGTDRGLFRFVGGKTRLFDTRSGLGHSYIRTLTLGRSGLLAGTRNGSFLWTGSAFKPLLPDADKEWDITAQCEDEQGDLWIGTNGSGLACISDNRILSWTTEDGLPDNHVLGIVEKDGWLWISSFRGLFGIEKKSLEEEKKGPLAVVWFDETDGMASSHCSIEGQPALFQTRTGLAVPTAAGIVVLDPDKRPKAGIPSVKIESLTVDGETVRTNTFRAPVKTLEIQFTALNDPAPEKIRFRVKLEDVDTAFILLPPEERTARYSGIKPGRYRFIVDASSNGTWNGNEIEFTILAPWSRYAAGLGTAVVMIMAAFLILRLRRKESVPKEKYKTSSLSEERADTLAGALTQLMEQEKPYLNPALTLRDLAKQLHTHPNHVSRIINQRFRLSYNDYVNQYRIEEAKHLLQDPKSRSWSLSAILEESGFYSKSVFNTAFKEFTGKTPSEYRQELQSQQED